MGVHGSSPALAQSADAGKGSQVVLEDLSAILPPASVLQEHNVPYSVKLAPSVSLADMTNGPVILIGGPTNKWTLTVTESLSYRIYKTETTLSIVDAHQTSSSFCAYQTTPAGAVLNDCALISRFRSSLTGNTVIVIAGAGRNGTQAAGEWITLPTLSAKLSELFGNGWQKKNLEIVLKTEVIEGKNRVPTVVRVASW